MNREKYSTAHTMIMPMATGGWVTVRKLDGAFKRYSLARKLTDNGGVGRASYYNT
jgi:hypothetical protein